MFRRFFSYVVIIGLITSQLCDTARALGVAQPSFDADFYAGNQILFYDPRCDNETAAGYLTLAGKDNLERTLNFLMRHGLSLAQASGVVGNLMAESGLNPAIIQGGGNAPDNYIPVSGTGFGIAQWTFSARQVPLLNYSRQMGVAITDLGLQLNFLWKELNEGYASTLASLKATDDPVRAAVIFHDGYEGSADSNTKVVTSRGGNATRVYQTYSDRPAIAGSTAPRELNNPGGNDENDADALAAVEPEVPSTGPTITGNCSGGGFGGGNLAETVVAYAWPEYAVRTDQMPAYSEAVTKAKSEGRYIGGNNGNDCGAFVTLLVRNSGFDPGYNKEGFGGNTILQEMWLSQNWERISSTDGADRQPGDVAINATHTYIYVGDIGNFGSKIASASLGGPQRSPMAGHESPTDSSFRWYRIKAPSNKNDGKAQSTLQATATGGAS